MYKDIYINIYTYIYRQREREREKERAKEREREREKPERCSQGMAHPMQGGANPSETTDLPYRAFRFACGPCQRPGLSYTKKSKI